MKKIILILLLALVNVNAVAAFSLDIDGNGTINASNDGLIIFKYLLNSNANNLHTTISSNAADDRKTTAQLKAYLDSAGDILDIDGNGTINASNDGLIVFKYLLNSNANNLHTTIASNAVGSKTTTINLKAYLDQYTSTDVSNMYSGDRPTELTAEQIADANGAADDSNAHLTVLRYANFGDYVVNILSDKIVIRDESDNYAIVYEITSSENNLAQLDDAEFQALYLEVIQAIWDLINPATAAEELVAIFALGTSPTALADYSALDAEADGIGQTERAQHIVDSLTNLNGVTVTYTSSTTPKSFDVAKAGETTINVLQDSSSGGAVSLDTLSVFKDIYFQTIQAKWDILHTAVTERQSRINQLDALKDKYSFEYQLAESDAIGAGTFVTVSWDASSSFQFSDTVGSLELVEPWADRLQAFEDQINPPVTVESEVADLYALTEPPTGFIANSLIDAAAQSYDDYQISPKAAFLLTLESTNYRIPQVTNTDGYATARIANQFTNDAIEFVPADNAGIFGAMSKQQFSDFTFKIILAIWHLEHPNYVDPTTHAARAAVLTAYNSIDGISNIEVKVAANNGIDKATVYLDWNLNGGGKGFTFWYFSATNPTVNAIGEVEGDLSYLSPGQFETYRERLYNKLTDHIQTPAKLRAARIVEIKVLDDASDNVIITNYIDPTDGDTFIIDVLGEPSLQSEYSTTTYESGVQGFGYLGTNEWAAMKQDISDKIDEIDIALTPTITDELAAFYSGEAPDTIATGGDAYGNQLPPAIHTAAVAAWNTNIHDTMLAFLRTLSQEATGNFGDSTDPVTTNGISYYGSTGFVVVRNLDRGQVSGTVAQGGDGGYGYHDIDLGSPTLYLNGWSNLNFTHLSETNFTTLAYHVMSNFYDLQQTVRQTRILDLLSIDSRLYVSRTDDGSADSVRRDSGSGYQNIGVNHYGSTQTGVTTFEGLSPAQYAHYRAYVVALQF